MIIIKAQVQTEKKKGKYSIEYSLTSAADGPWLHGWGPRWNLGAHAVNGVPSAQIFHFNHWAWSLLSLSRVYFRGQIFKIAYDNVTIVLW